MKKLYLPLLLSAITTFSFAQQTFYYSDPQGSLTKQRSIIKKDSTTWLTQFLKSYSNH
ncbi:MAG: hypothetical protein ACXVBH_09975 [Flavisolibacter sp.]